MPDPLEVALRELEMAEFGAPLPAPDPTAGEEEFADIVPDPVEFTAPASIPEALNYWLSNHSRTPAEAGRNLRELAAKAPDTAAEVLMPLYESGTCGDAAPLVASLLGRNSRAFEKLRDPAAPLESCIAVAQALARQEPRFDTQFAKNLLSDENTTQEALERGFTILEQLDNCGRLLPILIQFLRSNNARFRSRAALTLGRIVPPRNLMYRLMRDEDDRVRANFVEGLWLTCGNHAELFRQALRDRHHRVVGNALIGLQRAGHSRDVIQHITRMARNPEASFRMTAAWVMGQTGEDRYNTVLRHLVHDPDAAVRRNALISLRRIREAQAAAAVPPTSSLPTAASSPASSA